MRINYCQSFECLTAGQPIGFIAVDVRLTSDVPAPNQRLQNKKSISETESMRSWEDAREELLALGIVEKRPEGNYPHYTAILEPWWTPATASSWPPDVDESTVARDREHEMLFEISVALALEEEDELFTWTGMEPPSTDAIYDASEQLRRWWPMLAAAFADREDLIDLPPQANEVVVLG